MSHSAQDEADALLDSQKKLPSAHPEDLAHFSGDEYKDDDDDRSDEEDEHNEKRTNRIRAARAAAGDSDESDIDFSSTMVSKPATYHIPSTIYDANTGPKGVIADAQSFERAKKRSFRRTLTSASAFDYNPFSRSNQNEKHNKNSSSSSNNNTNSNYIHRGSSPGDDSAEGSDEDERFMRQWRETRMQELQNKATRRVSPSKRRYGNVDTVDATGYLDAIEKVTPGTVVVVCIYDPEVRPPKPPPPSHLNII
ncbi:hypothetical protein MGYG_06171 [Nannizzia gypsea CBS 118893]|uniref:Phosducin domain-containing protein n=1 Tax=Arthroderma gypseum (strain ATCC MYA-4604 / CBS 118893) TaxID=535722 RepID=E4V0N8_ARTGP|nr:hypothetical protein MGYG_06171 [Nannizzia gypsea CBS 118893]EFR03175.1 hypothetical protein MGYG_06171 [Nannizzia gypsea CBS 118893]